MQELVCCYLAVTSTFWKTWPFFIHMCIYMYILYFFHTAQIHLSIQLWNSRIEEKMKLHFSFSEKKIIRVETVDWDCPNSLWIFRDWVTSHGPHVTPASREYKILCTRKKVHKGPSLFFLLREMACYLKAQFQEVKS